MIYRSDMHRIQVSVSGLTLPAGLCWDTFEGGDVAGDNTYYHGGNMAPAAPTGGLRTPTDITVSIAWSDTIFPYYVALYNAATFTGATVSVTPLTMTKAATVKPLTWTGLLMSATKPNFEAAASSIGYLSCMIAPADAVSQN